MRYNTGRFGEVKKCKGLVTARSVLVLWHGTGNIPDLI
jgi:hypothetical protein